MSRWSALHLASILATAILPVGACSSNCGCTDTGTRSTMSVPGDDVRTVQLVVRHDDGRFEDFPISRWPLRTLDMIREFPMESLVVNEEGYAVGFASIDPPVPGVEYPPEGVPLDDVTFDEDGRLASWTLAVDDTAPCPGEDETFTFIEPADDATFDVALAEAALFQEVACPEQSIDDPADVQIMAFFDTAWDESRFFEVGDDDDVPTTEVADARRDEDYSDSW